MYKKYVENENFAASINTTGDYVATQMNNKISGSFTFTTSGMDLTVTKSDATIVTGTITEDGSINWGNSQGDVATKEWEIDTDNGTVGLSVGDLVKPTNASLTNEKFYVIGKENGTVTLLAQYCVNWSPSVNAQDNTMGVANNSSYTTTGALAFDNTEPYSNVYADSEIKPYVDAYAEKFTGMTIKEARLMLISEAEALDTNILYGTTPKLTYWLGSPANYSYTVWRVIGNYGGIGDGNVRTVYDSALRPVFEVLESNF